MDAILDKARKELIYIEKTVYFFDLLIKEEEKINPDEKSSLSNIAKNLQEVVWTQTTIIDTIYRW